MSTYSIDDARENFDTMVDEVLNGRSIIVTTPKGNIVLVTEDYWEGVLETLYLMGDPEFEEDVLTGLDTPESERIEWNRGPIAQS